ncbi:50S ribosomal protein L7 [Lacticaseibacillus chiayiensis]|uniref:50S ribosomal protein L7 n=1 Tax=Lacticaseibacillus chiayiensis TaxID=2100821 RepID=A0A4Q1TLI5_9LACO|nr:YlxQ-related RNA-binding protein [Lacticaseibacillus chiayiensis]QVI33557.1 YlxQ-related RNA-binding protein [Lacticaseibacillus chiayiensis]RXT19081.1 50S ribosomal protein L7 [Lacticaseibacillus chiayiensis]UYN55301.1 YlxQ-related RNA-binding protein [Lacticaseibacillus chiayiensis]
MQKQAVLKLLGLARRASRLTTGDQLVLGAIRSGDAKLVFVASDASANTRKKFSDKSSYYKVPLVTVFSKMDLSQAIGSDRSIIAVADAGFAKKMQELLT